MTTITCPATKGFCLGFFNLYETVPILIKKPHLAKTRPDALMLLATAGFRIRAHGHARVHFRLSRSGKTYLHKHAHGRFIDETTGRVGHGRLSTAKYAVKLKT